jgi:hypothetical protein
METVSPGSNTTEVETACEDRGVSLGSSMSLDERLFDECIKALPAGKHSW